MLADKAKFDAVEKALTDSGFFSSFEKQNGKLAGRMMIDVIELPEEFADKVVLKDGDIVFRGTFDISDCELGVAVNPAKKEIASGLWVKKQTEKNETIPDNWKDLFIRTITSHVGEDGSFKVPMFTFIGKKGDITIVPSSK